MSFLEARRLIHNYNFTCSIQITYFQNRVLRIKFELTTEIVRGNTENCIRESFIICNLHEMLIIIIVIIAIKELLHLLNRSGAFKAVLGFFTMWPVVYNSCEVCF
jgi:Mn2+/Fe2+ NRAMP family transporter